MYLSQIQISGFKSFLNKTVIELEKNKITVVIGPNGGGKSNIFDAVRWAIGEQSMKSLRSPSTADIIFSGSEDRIAVNLAQVHLNFINDEEIEIPKYGKINELQISRKLFRDGNNQYLINQTQCRLLDVKMLLMDLGLSYAGYSFIEQGNVTQIVNNTAEENRKIIEEAAGLMKFKTLKKESENKLQNTKNNLDRVEDRRIELEEQNQKLYSQAEVVDEYLQIKGRIDLLKKQIFSYQWQAAKKILNRGLQTRKTNLPDVTKGISAELEKSIDEQEQKITNQNKTNQNLQNSYQQTDTEFQKLESELKTKEDIFNKFDQLLLEQENENEVLKKKSKELQTELSVLQQKETNLVQEINKYRENKLQLKAELDKFTLQNNQIQNSKNTLVAKQQEIDLNLAKNQTNIEFLINKISEQTHKKQLAFSKENREKLIFTWREKKAILKKLADLKKEQVILENENNELTDLVTKNSKVEQENKQKLEQLKTNVIRLEQTILHKKDFFELEKSIEEFKKKMSDDQELAKMIGFRGFLRDLITIKQSAPREVFHLFDNFFSVVLFDSKAYLNQIIKTVESLEVNQIQILFLDSISKPIKSNKQLIQYFSFADNLEKLQDFFAKIQTLSMNSVDLVAGNSFYTEKLFSLFPLLLEYKNNKISTISEKYTNFKNSIIELDQQFKIKKTEQETLNLQIGKVELELQQQKIDLKTAIKTLESLRKEISATEQKFWKLENEYFNQRKVMQEWKSSGSENENLKQELVKQKLKSENLKKEKDNLLKQISTIAKNFIENKQILTKTQTKDKENEIKLSELLVRQQYLTTNLKKTNEDLKYTEKIQQKKAASIVEFIAGSKNNKQLQELKLKLKQKEEEKNNIQQKLREQRVFATDLHSKHQELKRDFLKISTRLKEEEKIFNNAEIEIAQYSEKMKSYEEQLQENFNTTAEEVLRYFSEEYFSTTKAKQELSKLQLKMPLYSDINLAAKTEYKAVNEKLTFFNEQKKDLEDSCQAILESIVELDKNSKETFLQMYHNVNQVFQKLFAIVFEEGKAFLKLTNEADTLNTGVELFAQPKGKRMQHLRLFSSGEKSLIGLVYIFAVLTVNPSLFCFLDEVDAALDMANVNRIVSVIKEIAKNNQILMITHNHRTIVAGDIFFGVSMAEKGISQVFSVEKPI